MTHRHLTLYELNSLVRNVIDATLNRTYWVEAELSEAREVRGHCYMELIQKDLYSPTPVARASAKCWKSTWLTLRPRFERATGQTLHAGLKVLLRVSADFHEAYGFSWIVHDIDPSYTMGDMARKRQEIIAQLKEEGVFDMQRELTLPLFAQRIAVISSEHAAGYGDFCQQLRNNDYGLRFYPTLFPAIMQGEQVETSIISALNAINDQADQFDAVVIIRGGGATADMSGFDTLARAENVAQFPLPVITGIGHDRDESILDMVSCIRVKTPTAAATLFVDHLAEILAHVEGLQERILSYVTHQMQLEEQRLARLAERIPLLFSNVRALQDARLDRMAAALVQAMNRQIMHERHRISTIEQTLPMRVERLLTREKTRMEKLHIRLQALDPALLLRRGYSITLHNGHALRDPAQVKAGDKLETRVEKGTVISVVE